MTPPDLPGPHPLDGVRPRHAYCPACRYTFGGVPIRGGSLVCPECGHVFEFTLRRPRPASRLRDGLALPLALAGLALLAGWLLATLAAGAVLAIACVAILLLVRGIRGRALPD